MSVSSSDSSVSSSDSSISPSTDDQAAASASSLSSSSTFADALRLFSSARVRSTQLDLRVGSAHMRALRVLYLGGDGDDSALQSKSQSQQQQQLLQSPHQHSPAQSQTLSQQQRHQLKQQHLNHQRRQHRDRHRQQLAASLAGDTKALLRYWVAEISINGRDESDIASAIANILIMVHISPMHTHSRIFTHACFLVEYQPCF